MTVVPFERPTPPQQARLAYQVDIYLYPNGNLDMNVEAPDGTPIQPVELAAAFAKLTQVQHEALYDTKLLALVGTHRTQAVSPNGAFETADQRRWLGERLDDIYLHTTGRPRSRNAIRAFFQSLFKGARP